MWLENFERGAGCTCSFYGEIVQGKFYTFSTDSLNKRRSSSISLTVAVVSQKMVLLLSVGRDFFRAEGIMAENIRIGRMIRQDWLWSAGLLAVDNRRESKRVMSQPSMNLGRHVITSTTTASRIPHDFYVILS